MGGKVALQERRRLNGLIFPPAAHRGALAGGGAEGRSRALEGPCQERVNGIGVGGQRGAPGNGPLPWNVSLPRGAGPGRDVKENATRGREGGGRPRQRRGGGQGPSGIRHRRPLLGPFSCRSKSSTDSILACGGGASWLDGNRPGDIHWNSVETSYPPS